MVTAEGSPAGPILRSVRSCGGTTHRLQAEPFEGVAQRTCVTCGSGAFVGDSAVTTLPNRGLRSRLRSDGEVRCPTVGQRCMSCGVLGAMVDWKVSYGPSTHLLAHV